MRNGRASGLALGRLAEPVRVPAPLPPSEEKDAYGRQSEAARLRCSKFGHQLVGEAIARGAPETHIVLKVQFPAVRHEGPRHILDVPDVLQGPEISRGGIG